MIPHVPLNVLKVLVSLGSLLLALVGGVVAFTSFLRSEKWKKAEFLAKEMNDFFKDKSVQKAMRLIDWDVRRVRLLAPESNDSGAVVVTRTLQVNALRPHRFLGGMIADPESLESFTPAEVAIRDCYDTFLDGLEKFSSYVKTRLVELSALRPYIGYWIDHIYAPAGRQDEVGWTAALLTYITYYQYEGVLWLFKALDHDIAPSSKVYRGCLTRMTDQQYASKLARSVDVTYP